MTRFITLSLLISLAVVAGACKNEKVPAGAGTDSAAAAAKSMDTAQIAPGSKVDTTKPATGAPANPEVTATGVISTSMGEIAVEFYGKDAPKAVENFIGLAKKKYFEGIAFHRCIPGFVIQGGDPNSKDPAKRQMWGTGGESIYGKAFADELDPATPSYKLGYQEGTLAMANSGPNTNGSQFFIITGPQGMTLPHMYTIFGKVTKGMDVVHKIEATGAQGEIPANPATMKKVTIGGAQQKTAKKDEGDIESVTTTAAVAPAVVKDPGGLKK